ncbi:MAG: group 1 truncated hemoglobin [Phenylobacterium sp.]|nr:group 1 truncated hemoglobin [Phenylobacterium sp.]
MRPIFALSLAAVLILPLPAAAQPTPWAHPGEEAIDPYAVDDANAGAAPMAEDAVFEALGGVQGVSRIIDDLVDRSVRDPRLEEIFKPTDLARLRRTLKEQVCFILGGPCAYTGRDMAAAHKDLGITTAEFNALVENLQGAMDDAGVPFRAQNRLLARLAPMKGDVVER